MPELNELRLPIATRRKRAAAFLIDHFVIVYLIVTLTFGVAGDFISDENSGSMVSAMFSVMIPGFFLYFIRDSINGTSLGKWVMGIKVCDRTNPDITPSFGRLLLRNLFIIIWPIELIALIASEEKRRLGDKFTNTEVVENPQKPKRLPRVLTLVGLAVIFFIFLFVFIGRMFKNSDAYKVAIQNIEVNEEIRKETGGVIGYGFMPTGNISINNGHGTAQLSITVHGNTKDITVDVNLEKDFDEQWIITELKLNK